MNPLFNMLGGNAVPPQMQNLMAQFQQFRNTFKGDPRQQVQQMLNSGRISQNDYNSAVTAANQLASILGIRF